MCPRTVGKSIGKQKFNTPTDRKGTYEGSCVSDPLKDTPRSELNTKD